MNTKKQSAIIAVLLAALAVTAGALYLFPSREQASELLPTPVAYEPSPLAPTSSVPTTPAQPTSTKPQTPPTKATSTTPAPAETIKKEVNLAVPFLSQAPKQNWDMPYQEACEEASMIMASAYYSGTSQAFTPEAGDKAILDLVAYEEQNGFPVDVNAEEVTRIMSVRFPNVATRILKNPSVQDLQRELSAGRLVILPADGKALDNPNFRNGGPPYHMLVIKGYTADGRWITNDPGTRKGADFLYSQENLMTAMHDWNGGNVPQGEKLVIIVSPRS